MTQQPPTLGDRYRLEEVIGRGGMAEVWRAEDIRLDRQVAIKRLRIDLATDPTFHARFQREAQSAAGLNHPNIVAVYDTGEQIDPRSGIDVPYIVMELVQGHTLKELLRDGRKIVPEKALEFTIGVLNALGYSHERGIVHRDIKPANVMLTSSGTVKVMDFGIARAVADTSSTMTQTAAVIGTAQYLSPEQARGETVDYRSDIYSAGCLLYELLTGRPPFIGDSPVSVAYQHVRETPIPPSQLDPEITPAMDAVTMTALAKDPADRYQTARDMRDDITRLLGGEPVTATMSAVTAIGVPQDGQATQVMPSRAAQPAAVTAPLSSADTPKDPPRRRLSAATVILVILLLALFSAIAFIGMKWLLPTDPEVTTVAVPRVIGYQEEAARSQLTNARLVPSVTQTTGPMETKGQVIQQLPVQDAQVRVGSTVTITVNLGPGVSTIPDGLVGKPEAEARRILRDAGITSITVQEAAAGTELPEYLAGQVVSVSPAPGTQVSPTEPVVLYLATGKSIVPKLVGLNQTAAKELANRLGFPNVVVREEASTSPVGQVIGQIPGEGETWNRADRITIIVAKSPPVQTVTVSPPPPSSTAPPTTPPPTGPATSAAPTAPAATATATGPG